MRSNYFAYLAGRLDRDHPDEAARLERGEVSLHAAAVRAGIRPRRVSVVLDNPVSIVNTLERGNAAVLVAVRDEIERRLALTE